jgi:hypothetical protein
MSTRYPGTFAGVARRLIAICTMLAQNAALVE